MDLELPPLGEVILCKSDSTYQIGYFYTREGVKGFRNIFTVDNQYWFTSMTVHKEWKHIPKFTSIEKKPIPIGRIVVVKYKDEDDENTCFKSFAGIVGYKNTHCNGNKIIGWIEYEKLKE